MNTSKKIRSWCKVATIRHFEFIDAPGRLRGDVGETWGAAKNSSEHAGYGIKNRFQGELRLGKHQSEGMITRASKRANYW